MLLQIVIAMQNKLLNLSSLYIPSIDWLVTLLRHWNCIPHCRLHSSRMHLNSSCQEYFGIFSCKTFWEFPIIYIIVNTNVKNAIRMISIHINVSHLSNSILACLKNRLRRTGSSWIRHLSRFLYRSYRWIICVAVGKIGELRLNNAPERFLRAEKMQQSFKISAYMEIIFS